MRGRYAARATSTSALVDASVCSAERMSGRVAGVPTACVPRRLLLPGLLPSGEARWHLTVAGLKPGPVFKRVLDAVYDAQLEDRVKTKDEALALALKLVGETT